MEFTPTPDDIRTYQQQGFVHLKQVLSPAWLDVLGHAIHLVEEGVDQQPRVRNVTKMRRALDAMEGRPPPEPDATGDFIMGHNTWQWNEPLRRLAFESPLPGLAQALMGAGKIVWYFDQAFIKEADSLVRTAFHQDLGYWTCKGDQICTFWIPLDRVTMDNGAMGYVPGSHRWEGRFKANRFLSRKALPGQLGEDLPHIEADEEKYGVVYCPCEPGDVVVHHVRTVHGSTGNRTAARPRRSVALRYTGDGVVYHEPPGLPPESVPLAEDLQDGDPLSGPLFPQLR